MFGKRPWKSFLKDFFTESFGEPEGCLIGPSHTLCSIIQKKVSISNAKIEFKNICIYISNGAVPKAGAILRNNIKKCQLYYFPSFIPLYFCDAFSSKMICQMFSSFADDEPDTKAFFLLKSNQPP